MWDMSLSRLAVLAVFFMMVMSAFVTVPTYNVGADEGGCMDYDDENGNGAYDEGEPCYDDECPFDPDNSDSPCNAQECEDHESDACTDFVLNYCANNDDPGCYALMADFVCYDMETHEVNFDIRNEEDCYDEDRPEALSGINGLITSIDSAISIAFNIVPIPGVSLIGIQRKRTNKLIINVDSPTEKSVCSVIP